MKRKYFLSIILCLASFFGVANGMSNNKSVDWKTLPEEMWCNIAQYISRKNPGFQLMCKDAYRIAQAHSPVSMIISADIFENEHLRGKNLTLTHLAKLKNKPLVDTSISFRGFFSLSQMQIIGALPNIVYLDLSQCYDSGNQNQAQCVKFSKIKFGKGMKKFSMVTLGNLDDRLMQELRMFVTNIPHSAIIKFNVYASDELLQDKQALDAMCKQLHELQALKNSFHVCVDFETAAHIKAAGKIFEVCKIREITLPQYINENGLLAVAQLISKEDRTQISIGIDVDVIDSINIKKAKKLEKLAEDLGFKK